MRLSYVPWFVVALGALAMSAGSWMVRAVAKECSLEQDVAYLNALRPTAEIELRLDRRRRVDVRLVDLAGQDLYDAQPVK